jgi:hypothetical protein
MNIKIVQIIKLGRQTEYQLFINGESYPLNHESSRLLTNTICESREGIFTHESDLIEFIRAGDRVVVYLKAWNPDEYDPIQEIIERVRTVNAAFDNYSEVTENVFLGHIADY